MYFRVPFETCITTPLYAIYCHNFNHDPHVFPLFILFAFAFMYFRVSFDLPIIECDNNDDPHPMFENTSTSHKGGYGMGMSGSAMGDSILLSSISQPDGDIESTHRNNWLQQQQQWLRTHTTTGTLDQHDINNDGNYPYPLNRRMRAMLDSLNKNKYLDGESNIHKDRELEQHPETEAQFDRLAGTLLLFVLLFSSSIFLLYLLSFLSTLVFCSVDGRMYSMTF